MSAVKKRSSRLCRSRTVGSWPCLGVLVAVLALLIGPASLSPAPALAVTEKQPYIVRFKDGVDPGREDASLARLSPRFRRVFDKVFNGATVDLTDAEAARLRSDPRVEAVEPDRAVSLAEVQVGPSWGLDRIDQRSLPLSGTYSYPDGGATVTAYVVDTGIRADHVDFGGRVAPGMTIINDGRGTGDCYGHGTKIAGTLGGSTYGVAKTVTLVPVRIGGCSGLIASSGILAALEWIIGDHVPGTPAVANMSVIGPRSSLIDDAVARVVAAGVTVVAAAGNDSSDACEYSPAGSRPAITVGAADGTDTPAWYSNQGSCVDLFAPGVGVTTTWHTSSTATGPGGGTSIATPHVAGAAAVLLSQQPSLSPAEVADHLVTRATLGAVKNVKPNTTDRLLYSGSPGPANDDLVQATPLASDGTSQLRGPNVGAGREAGEPAHAGRAATSSVWWRFAPPTKGLLTLSTAGSSFDTVLGLYSGYYVGELTEVGANDDSDGDPWSGLTAEVEAGKLYYVAVDGRGGQTGAVVLGYGFKSTVPPASGAPSISSVSAGDQSVTVAWTPPTGGGAAITSYVVRVYVGADPVRTHITGSETTTKIGNLQNGQAHTVTVAVRSSAGPGPESPASEPVTPRSAADAPIMVQATGVDRGAVISWAPPEWDGGAPIVSYKVTIFAGGTRVRSDVFPPATAASILQLANGTSYTFTVAAMNAAGTGPDSAPSPAVVPAEPVSDEPPLIASPPAVNQPPVAAPDSFQATAGSSISVAAAQGVLANDQDPDGDVLTAVVVGGPSHGTIKMDAFGGFTYTPASGWVGSDAISYEARDGLGGISSATVTFHTSAAAVALRGYWMLSDSGKVYSFGNAQSFGDGSSGATDLESTPDGDGYWILNADGAVGNFGTAPDLGGSPRLRTGEEAASLSVTPSGAGYWIFTDAGRVFAYGDAAHLGDMSGTRLNGPVLDSVSTPSGRGYWLVASDGGIFSFGDAKFFGSMGNTRLNQPVISMAPDPDGTGYWLVAADGGIFAFDATFHGSMGNVRLNKPVSGMVPGSAGYLMVAEDGGIFAFGDVAFHGSLGSAPPPRPVVAVALVR